MIIPWDNVKALQYQALVIAGYGATTVVYTDTKGKERRLNILPSANKQYQDVVRFLIANAKGASIDPSLGKVLEYPPKDAMVDTLIIPLSAMGVFLILLTATLLYYYSPTITASRVYPLLVIPFGLLPMGMTMKLIVGRFRGKRESASKKIFWGISASAGPILAMLTFFVISPFSMHWLIGDFYMKTGDTDKAEVHYGEALKIYPESIDVLYEMGKVYRKRKDWAKAFEYLKKAYEQDPSYWGPAAVVLLPDTLMKMGRYEEALKMCEQILKDHPNKIDIARRINKKQDEIIYEMRFNKKD